jgi:hypothetical protein
MSCYKKVEACQYGVKYQQSKKVKENLPHSRRRRHEVNGWSVVVVSRK